MMKQGWSYHLAFIFMDKTMKRNAFFIFITSFLLFSIYIASLSWIKHKTTSHLSSYFKSNISYSTIQITHSGEVVISGLEIATPGVEKIGFIKAPTVFIRLSWYSLFSKNVIISEITFYDSAIDLNKENFLKLLSVDLESGTAETLTINRVAFNNCKLTYPAQTIPLDIIFDRLNFETTYDIQTNHYYGNATIVSADIKKNDQWLQLDQINLEWEHNNYQANINATFRCESMKNEYKNVSTPVTMSTSSTLHWENDHLILAGIFKTDSLLFKDVLLEQALIEFNLDEQQLQLSKFQFRCFGSKFTGDGSYNFNKNKAANPLNLQFDGIINSLTPFTQRYKLPLITGKADLRVNVYGELTHPSVELNVRWGRGFWDSFRFDSLQSSALLDDEKLVFRKITMFGNHQALPLHGWMALGKEFEIISDATELPLSIKGNFVKNDEMKCDIIGDHLDLKFLSNFFSDEAFSPGLWFYKNCNVHDLKVDLQLHLTETIKNPKVDGRLTWSFDDFCYYAGPYSIDSGKVDLQLHGNVQQPEIHIQWSCHGLSRENFKADCFNGEMEYRDSTIILKNMKIAIDQNESFFEGQLPLRVSLQPFQIDFMDSSLHFKSYSNSVQLSVLLPLLPLIQTISGELNYDIEISGSLKEPNISGRVNIDNTNIKLRQVQSPITALNARLNFDGQRALLNYLTARIGSGDILLTGFTDFQVAGQESNFSFEAEIAKVDFNYRDYFSTVVDTGNIKFSRDREKTALTGFINFDSIRIIDILDMNFLTDIVNEANDGITRLGKDTFIDFKVKSDGNFWFSNQWSQIQMAAFLDLHGIADSLSLAGEISFIEGVVHYFGRKFDITNGVITFNDSLPMNPHILIKAVTKIKSYENITNKKYTITLILSGDLKNHTIGLSSEPYLSPSDITGILTVGRTRQQPGLKDNDFKNESFTDILMERAKTFTDNSMKIIAEKQLGTLLSLDEVIIDGNLLDLNSKKKTKFIASKKLSSGLDLTYSTVVGYANKQRMTIGYKLSDRVSIESETDQEGKTGIDLKFKYKFK